MAMRCVGLAVWYRGIARERVLVAGLCEGRKLVGLGLGLEQFRFRVRAGVSLA